ncbi:MAG: hypothetical protein SOW59_00595 [Corynebacterium sp.]|nr:hypothetical protein [Corynebacterium sp.]
MNNNRLVLSVVVASAFGIGSCSTAEIAPEPIGLITSPVAIGVDNTDLTSQVLAEIYAGTLRKKGRQSQLVPIDESTFRVTCTGKELWELDSHRARELAEEFSTDDFADDPHVITHNEMMGALSPELTTNDPSRAGWCDDFTAVDLPLDIVPIYDATLLDSEERLAVTMVTKYLTNADLQELIDNAQQATVEVAVGQWLNTSVVGGVLENRDSTKKQDNS